MSEDLEKIKQLCDVEVPYNEVCSIHANALGEIQEAAERMTDEIARLKAELTASKENELKAIHEMGWLKAELAKRPEVVFCKDCRAMQKGDQIDPERLTCVHGAIVEPYDFCSMGRRRESEVEE